MLNFIKALKKYFYKSQLKLSIDLSQNLKILLIIQVFAAWMADSEVDMRFIFCDFAYSYFQFEKKANADLCM